MQMVSVDELVRALRDYSAGGLEEEEARALAERALAEAEAARDIWLFDRVRYLSKQYAPSAQDSRDATNQGGIQDGQSQKLDNGADLAACTVSAATGRARCWCGRDAVISREGSDVTTHYCSEHWALWWESALLDTVLTVAAI
jgi:hypothetical protein